MLTEILPKIIQHPVFRPTPIPLLHPMVLMMFRDQLI